MTTNDKMYACIALRIPRTGDKELDALIAAAQRRDLAAKIASGMASSTYWSANFCSDKPHVELAVRVAVECANALLAELAKKGEKAE